MRNDLVDNIRLNMNTEQVRACVYVRAGDTRTRTLHFTFVKDGKVVDLSDLLYAEIVILKPDGHETVQSMTRYGNELHYTLRTQDINAPGNNRSQINLAFRDGATEASPEFSIMVYDKLDPRYETSENEYTALNQKMALVEQAVEDAQAAVEAAQGVEADMILLRDEVRDMRDETEGYKDDSAQSAQDASDHKDAAAGSASDAYAHKLDAAQSASEAESSATDASARAIDAMTYMNDAASYAQTASTQANAALLSAERAESWAIGGTGSRVGEDTNNAKYWSDQSSAYAMDSSGYASDALLYRNASESYATEASGYVSDAADCATDAFNSAKKSESWAVGGTGTRTGEDTNNAKYWAEQAALASGHTIQDESGTDMPAEPSIQFTGATVTDDSVNNRTVVAIPAAPTVNDGTLTIQQNGVTLGTFTANQSGNTTVDITGGGGGSGSGTEVVDETTESVMTFDADYVEVSNHNFVLIQSWETESESVVIDTGYCTKVTPFVAGITVSDVEVV